MNDKTRGNPAAVAASENTDAAAPPAPMHYNPLDPNDPTTLFALSNQFSVLSTAMTQYVYDHYKDLSSDQRYSIAINASGLMSKANDLLNDDMAKRLAGLPTNAIAASTAAMKDAVANLQTVEKVFKIATAAVTVYAGIATGGAAGASLAFKAAQSLMQVATGA